MLNKIFFIYFFSSHHVYFFSVSVFSSLLPLYSCGHIVMHKNTKLCDAWRVVNGLVNRSIIRCCTQMKSPAVEKHDWMNVCVSIYPSLSLSSFPLYIENACIRLWYYGSICVTSVLRVCVCCMIFVWVLICVHWRTSLLFVKHEIV